MIKRMASSVSGLGDVAKAILMLGLSLGILASSRASEWWGNPCRTFFYECRIGSCTDGGTSGCCVNPGGNCQCTEVASPCSS
jgi:hypothetical protein